MRSVDLTACSPWLKRLLTIAIVAVITTGMSAAFAACFQELATSPGPVRLLPIVMSLALYLTYCLLNAFGWTLVLRLLQAPINVATGITLWLKCEACRWIPGSVWNLGARSVAVTRHQVPLGVGAASLVVELGYTLTSWSLLAGCATFFYRRPMREGLQHLPPQAARFAPWLAALLVACGVLALLWRLRQPSDREADLRRALGVPRTHPFRALGVACYYIFINSLNGLALYCLVNAWSPQSTVPLLAVVGGNAIAWLIGFFVVIAPGGIVVREATLSVVLMNWLPVEQAVSIAVAWRVLQLAGEILLLLAINLPPLKSYLEWRYQ